MLLAQLPKFLQILNPAYACHFSKPNTFFCPCPVSPNIEKHFHHLRLAVWDDHPRLAYCWYGLAHMLTHAHHIDTRLPFFKCLPSSCFLHKACLSSLEVRPAPLRTRWSSLTRWVQIETSSRVLIKGLVRTRRMPPPGNSNRLPAVCCNQDWRGIGERQSTRLLGQRKGDFCTWFPSCLGHFKPSSA